MAQLVAHSLWERGVVSSSLAAPTSIQKREIMKRFIILSCLLSYLSTYTIIDTKKYEADAQHWVEHCIIHSDGTMRISPDDLHAILNLIFFSTQRSLGTVYAQDIGMQAVNAAWHGWQNIAQTRLDPAHELPYQSQYATDAETFSAFIAAQQEHHKTGMTYHHTVKEIVDGTQLQTTEALFAVDRLRLLARTMVLDSFLSIKQQITLLSDCAHQLMEKRLLEIDYEERGFLRDTVMSFLPGFALTSFLKLEHCYTTASSETWSALEKVQQVSILIYKTIEQERAAFYAAHYNALYQVLVKQKLSAAYHTIAFNEHGVIPKKLRTQSLPALLGSCHKSAA